MIEVKRGTIGIDRSERKDVMRADRRRDRRRKGREKISRWERK